MLTNDIRFLLLILHTSVLPNTNKPGQFEFESLETLPVQVHIRLHEVIRRMP